MKNIPLVLRALSAFLLLILPAVADEIAFANGRTIAATALQTNYGNVLILEDYGASDCAESSIKRIWHSQNASTRPIPASNALPDFRTVILTIHRDTITFTNRDRIDITDADVRVCQEGGTLVWDNDKGSAGLVKLADLPDPTRTRYRYDPAKSEKSSAAKSQRKAQIQRAITEQPAQALATQQASVVRAQTTSDGGLNGDNMGGGRVFVHTYFHSNGTYVHSYTRRN
jgi:hypothetical protein